jgi:hypothetical protein
VSTFSVRPAPENGSPIDWAPRVRELVADGKYADAVQLAYRSAFKDVVESFGLRVPASATDREFVRDYLRPDMGKIVEILPELQRLYEPVRFGGLSEGSGDAVLALVARLEQETLLGEIRRPLSRPRSAEPPSSVTSRPADGLGRSSR